MLSGDAYTNSAVERGSLQPGQTICVRTNDHRVALVTIVDVSEQAVEFGGNCVGTRQSP